MRHRAHFYFKLFSLGHVQIINLLSTATTHQNYYIWLLICGTLGNLILKVFRDIHFMLQKLNERIQGAVAWIVIVLVTVTFILFELDQYIHSHQNSDVKVTINDHTITKEDYRLNFRRMSQRQAQEPLTASQEQALKQQVLSEMMVNAVSVEAANARGFEVNGPQATAAILNIPQFQEDGHFSNSRYSHALINAFFTPQTFQQEVRQGMLLNQQRFALMGTEFVLPNELNHFVALSSQTRDYRYAIIKAAKFKRNIHITDEEEHRYYQAHKKQFMTQEQVSIEYIRLSLQAIKDTLSIAPDLVSRYYEDNKHNYLTPAQWQVDYLRFPTSPESAQSEPDQKQIKQAAQKFYELVAADPNQFSNAAQKIAKPDSGNFGTLPTIIAGQSNLDQHLINLTKVGQISQPILGELGYEVYQVKSYKPATIQPLADVRQLITEQLLQDSAQNHYAAMEEQLSELSYQNPDSLQTVANELKLKLEYSGLFSREHSNQDPITQHPAIKQAAFSNEVLNLGNTSDPIRLDADSLVILRVKKHIPAAFQDITQVKNVIDSILIGQKASLEAQTYGKNLLVSQTDSAMKALEWQKVTAASHDTELSDPLINELAFSLLEPGAYGSGLLPNGDFAIIQLSGIQDGQIDSNDKDLVRNFTQQLEASYGLIDYDLYISQLMSRAKIVN